MSETKRVFDVRYTPDYVQGAIAGKKGKRAARPILFDLRTFKVTTKEGETLLNSYLLFGGVPPKAIHDKLIDSGFKVRRRPAESTSKKDGTVYTVGDRDNDCWTIYYNTESTITSDQGIVIGNLITYFARVPTTGRSGLLASWEQVDEEYGKDEWLQICTVSDEKEEKTESVAPTVAAETIDEEALDTLFS